MRLIGVRFDRFKSIETSELPTDGLVVLFGVNNSGKSNALEGIGALLGQFRTGEHSSYLKPDYPGEPGAGTFPSGGLVVEFGDCESPNHHDHELVRALFDGAARAPGRDWDQPEPWKGPGPEPSLAELRSLWVELFMAHDSPIPHEQRRQLFEEMVGTPTFLVTPLQVSLVVPRSRLSQSALLTAAGLAESGNHPLCRWCTTCLNPSAAGIGIRWPATPTLGAVSATLRAAIAGDLPAVIRVNTTPEGIEQDLHRHLRAVSGTQHPPGSPLYLFGDPPHEPATGVLAHLDEARRPRFSGTDGWLEASGRLATSVTPEVVSQASLLAEVANRVAPGFVRELGSIGIELFPPSMFEAFPLRLRVVFRASATQPAARGEAGPSHDRRIGGLDTVGSGVGRWVCASLREAAWRLGGASRRAIYLVDEPEAHLHPAAADSVADWLTAAAERNAGVVIATHAPAFLNIASNIPG